jgi:hypothetical protein
MSTHLEEAFYGYMEMVVKRLQAEKRKFATALKSYPGFESSILGRILREVESSQELKSLVAATEATTPAEYFRYMAEPAVKNFFRRSGIYNQLREGRVPAVAPALDQYRAAFSRTSMRRTYLAPLDFLHMKAEPMRFQTFELRKFSEPELALFLGQEINRTYYNDAVLDLDNLKNFWWLLCHAEAPLQCKPHDDREPDPRVQMNLTPHREIEAPMRILALHNWLINPMLVDYFGDGVPGLTWTPPRLPFVMSVHDNLLQDPPSIQVDLSQLLLATIRVGDTDEYMDGPLDYWNFDEEESTAFEAFLRRTELMVLSIAEVPEWRFITTALDYLLKAFVSKGKEQLIWHITALESLLGQKGEALIDSIGRRLAQITTSDEKAQPAARKKFRELYNFRCDIVHGNTAGKESAEREMLCKHLNEARYFARDTLMWFLNLLTALREQWGSAKSGHPLPTRRDLLCLLDMSPAARAGMGELSRALPPNFPNVATWVT